MRESNFAFPAQNRACVCISSQLYDRRALDTTSPLPLFNSLTHLTYLTSTSPRIREILTMDGGLERLVRLLRDFCANPPPPESPSQFYGLLPPTTSNFKPHVTMHAPYDPQKPFDRAAAYRFSLAFQCLVNIGVRGSEPIRARVVQAGTLDVVGCVLEAWLASKGFAVAPSASASGMPRETREQRHARRLAMAELRQREMQALQAQELARALQRQVASASATTRPSDDDEEMLDASSLEADREANPTPPDEVTTFISSSFTPSTSAAPITTTSDTSNDTSPTSTPHGGSTPTGAVVVPGRDRSGTVVARPVWDTVPVDRTEQHARRRSTIRASGPANNASAGHSAARTDTEPESDADAEMEDATASGSASASTSSAPSAPSQVHAPPHHTPAPPSQQGRRAVGIVGDDDAAALEVNMTLNMLLAGVDDGFVTLEQNVGDDLAMGAPPGAPGNMNMGQDIVDRRDEREQQGAVNDLTPRAGFANLPDPTHPHPHAHPHAHTHAHTHPHTHPTHPAPTPAVPTADAPPNTSTVHVGQPHTHETGPYREEDVLLSLQLLAYLSKYPHVRQAFYKPRAVFNPAMQAANANSSVGVHSMHGAAPPAAPAVKEPTPSGSFFKALAGAAVGRNKDKDKTRTAPSTASPSSSASPSRPSRALTQSTNVFSLVERFTFRPSPNETALPSPPPLLPPEIQYWAGVIMRNACRKDESRGGIRQCANMLCGKWETFPREFAKCRRCRKAKYCGKECQSRAWAEGHRFWCSAREEEVEAAEGAAAQEAGQAESGARDDGTVRAPRGERVSVSVTVTSGNPAAGEATPHRNVHAGPSRQPSTTTTVTRSGPLRTTVTTTATTTTTTLYRAGPEAAGRGPPLGHASYTRNRVNAIAPHAAPQHAPYLHMAGAHTGANARRRAGTMPGPSVSTTDLPGTLREESPASSSGSATTRRQGSRRAPGPGPGPDDMVLG